MTTNRQTSGEIPSLASAAQVAEILGVTSATVRSMANNGRLTRIRFGRRCVRYDLAEVRRLIGLSRQQTLSKHDQDVNDERRPAEAAAAINSAEQGRRDPV